MPPTPSILSRASGKKFMSAVKRTFTRTPKETQNTPAEKKPDTRKAQDVKDEVAESHAKSEEAEAKDAAKTVDKAEAATTVVHPGRKDNPVPSGSNLPVTQLPALEEEIEVEAKVIGNYAVIFDHNNHENQMTIRYGNRSYYTPNAVSMFESLHASNLTLNANTRFQDKNLAHYSVAVSLYYSVLYYIRILQVREILGENTDSEARFYRAFQRKFKLESLPIAGFLEVDFANIAFYEPLDRRTSYVVPQFEAMFGTSAAGVRNYLLNDESLAIQPHPSILYEWIYFFSLAEGNGFEDHRTSRNTFVPRQGAAGLNFRLGGYELEGRADNHVDLQHLLILSTLGIDRPAPESIERLIICRQEWRNSGFTTGSPAMLGAAPNFANIADFLRMGANNFNWFQNVIDAAVVHAKQFNGLTYLGNIPVRGSTEIGIYSDVYINRPLADAADQRTVTLANGTVPWFPHIKTEFHGQLTWYEPTFKDYHFWMGMHTITNSTLTLRFNTGPDAADRQEIISYPQVTTAQNIIRGVRPARYGPYYDTFETGALMQHRVLGARGQSRSGMEVLDRRINLVRRFYVLDNDKNAW
jgi:hypothetical protein